MTTRSTYQAACFQSPREVAMVTLARPEISRHEMLVDVTACGVCGSDLALFEGEKEGTAFPVIAGHEIVGRVAEIGEDAAARRQLNVGDRVVLEEAVPCGACDLCRDGRHRLCQNGRRFGATAIAAGGVNLGGYAEVVTVPSTAIAHRIPDGVDDARATWFIPLSNGLSWLHARAALRPGETVVVLGPGQHGLGSALAAQQLGAGAVMVCGLPRDSSRLELVAQLGLSPLVVDDEGRWLGEVRRRTGGGADVVVDATPRSTRAVTDALAILGVGGRVILAGVKRGHPIERLDLDPLLFGERSLLGVNARESWAVDAALGLLARGDPSHSLLDGPIVPLNQLEHALELLSGAHGPPPVHVVVKPDMGLPDA